MAEDDAFFRENCNPFTALIDEISRPRMARSPRGRGATALFAPQRDDDFLIASGKNDAAVFDAFNRDLKGLSA